MKIIFKNFIYVLKRFKTSSILNILGLSAAFTVFIVLSIQVYYDLSYNRNFKDADDIYMLSSYSPHEDDHSNSFNTQTGDNTLSNNPIVQAYTTITSQQIVNTIEIHDLKKNVGTSIIVRHFGIRGNFVDVFSPRVLSGNIDECFKEGDNLAISEGIAKKVFGEKSPIGETIIDTQSKQIYRISAVIEDFPKNCSLKNGLFGHLSEQREGQRNYNVFVKVKKQDINRFQEYLTTKEFLGEDIMLEMEKTPELKSITSAIPLVDVHLLYPFYGNGDIAITISLLIIAIITLIIAYINYVNFFIAMAPARAKTVSIQHIFGIAKIKQRLMIATESAFFSIIAFIISLFLVNLLKGSPISDLFSANITIDGNQMTLIIIFLCIALLGFIFGLYPAKYVTNFNTIEALKGASANTVKSSKLRFVLITFQFTAAIILIIITLFIKVQYDYMVNYEWGMEKENIITIELSDKGVNKQTFVADLLKDPRIIDHTSAWTIPGYLGMTWGREFEGKIVNLKSWPVADDFLQFFGVPIIIGEDFTSLDNPEKTKIIFNEEFVRKHGFKGEDLIDKEFPAFNSYAQVLGIAKDVNFESLKMPIQPMGFVTLGEQHNSILFLRLSGIDTRELIKSIEDIWPKYSKETLDLRFLDQELEKLYRNENNLGKLVGIFSVITILIAIMGVYGLITFNTKYRMKEIAIRKVNGATEKSIMLLINKGMYIQLLIAFVIASPIAYMLVNKWLENFAYRTPIYWWIFPLAAIIILLITVVAVSWQSYRAAIMNPVKSLKSE